MKKDYAKGISEEATFSIIRSSMSLKPVRVGAHKGSLPVSWTVIVRFYNPLTTHYDINEG